MIPLTNAIACVSLAISFCSVLAAGESADERTIREIDAAWSQALQSKDLDKVMSNYAEDARFLPPDEPIVLGRGKIREWFEGRVRVPGFSASFVPTMIEVSRSEDMAYEVGTFLVAVDGASGKPIVRTGKHLVVWRKHNGAWKVVAESINHDSPSTGKP